ncbi:hypothetical protein [Microbulbifer sp. PAAF003]|uniref:hypothetical protein n=1 Tax=Microbulbifer sp. PAAF003 TaxID=3243375 RepID=UPI00403A6128
MEISVFHRLYNSFGGHRSISLVSEILENDEPDFGSAVEEIEVTVHFYHDGPARKSLEQTQENFHNNLKTLPKCTFYRKKKRIALDIEGTFTTGYEIERNKKPPIQINPDWVKATLADIIENLTAIKPKIKKSDDFSYEEFQKYLSKKLEEIPHNVEELENLQNEVRERRKAEFEKLDEWEKLGLDWVDFHPNAKDVVPVPGLWSCGDEFAPNGNDTGADTLGLFTDWNNRNKSKSPLVFLTKLLKGWEIDINKPYDSDYSSYTYFQATVGLAFASAKLRGECEQPLKEKAMQAIEKYLQSIAAETNWEHKNECEEKLTTSLSVLGKMPNKALQPING